MAKTKRIAKELLDSVHGANDERSPVFVGMVKGDDRDKSRIMFAAGTDCSRWTPISAAQVEKIVFIRNVQCQGHSHPLVQLHMHRPDTSEGHSFAALAQLHHDATAAVLNHTAHVASIAN